MWPRRRSSQRCKTEEPLLYKCQKHWQRTLLDGGELNYDNLSSRITSSRPTHRKTNCRSRSRIFDINQETDSELQRKTKNFSHSQNGVADKENQVFNMIPKTFGHHDNISSFIDHHRQQSPLKEIFANHRNLGSQNVFQDVPNLSSVTFDFSHSTFVREQKPCDSFLYNTESFYKNPVYVDNSPRISSGFSKGSDSYSEVSSNSYSASFFHKFPGNSANHSEEPFRHTSTGYYNTFIHLKDKLQSCGDFDEHMAKQIEEEPENLCLPDTPESRGGQLSPTESVYKNISILKKEFEDFYNDDFHSPMLATSPANYNLFSADEVPPTPSFRSTFGPNNQRSRIQLQPYLTDPDEEYARMRAYAVALNLPQRNFLSS